MSSSANSNAQVPVAAAGKAVANAPPTNSLTQVSLARLLGIGDAETSSRMTLTLNMASSSSGAAAVDPAAAVELASHERHRAKKRKVPEGPRGRAKSSRTTTEAKNVKCDSRLADFPNQGFKISAGVLFCQPCRSTLPNIKSSIAHHVLTKKHQVKLEEFERQQQADKDMRSELSDYFACNSDERQESSSLDTELHLFRLRTVEAFLMSGTPLRRLEYFRPIIERAGFSLTHHSHMRTYVPKIEASELNILKKELKHQFLCVAFDGTSRLGEAVNITGRWCCASFKLHHRLLRFATVKHHFKAAQLSSFLTRILCTDLGLDPNNITSFARDSVAVNGAACRLLCGSTFCITENMLCICHTLNNVGVQINFQELNSFMTVWLEFVGGQHPHIGARDLWRDTVAPQRVPGFSNVRWYSKAEIQFVLAENFQRLPAFLRQLDEFGYGDSLRQKMHRFLDDRDTEHKLKCQLAAMLDLRKLVRTTYELEGDRLEIMLVYHRIEQLRAFGRSILSDPSAAVLPNLDATLRSSSKLVVGTKISKFFLGFGYCEGKIIATGNFDSTLYPGKQCRAFTVKYSSDGTTEDLEEEEIRPLIVVKDLPERAAILEALTPAFEYLEKRLTGECEVNYNCAPMYEVCLLATFPLPRIWSTLSAYHKLTCSSLLRLQICRLAQAFDPVFATQHLTHMMVDELANIKPLMEHVKMEDLHSQLPAYLAAAMRTPPHNLDDVDAYTENILTFWRANTMESTMSAWRLAARIIFSFTPNSASCERVFSLLACMFGEGQEASLADMIQAALMLRYNRNKRDSEQK